MEYRCGACILSSVVGAPQQKRQQQQHILESRLKCFFSHSRTLVVRGTFLRVLYNNTHRHVAFARELEEKEEKYRAGPTSSTFHFSFSCGIVYSPGNRTPEREKRQTSVYLIKRKMKKKIVGIRTRYVYIPFCRAAVHKKSSHRCGCGLLRCTSPEL